MKKILRMLKKRGLKIAHMDSTLVAQEPKLFSLKKRIRRQLATLLGTPISSVGFKAKTNEGFGAIGKNQAMACYAIVSLKRTRVNK